MPIVGLLLLVAVPASAAEDAFREFAGTDGIWRREGNENAGGWQGDALTEDLDLSNRVRPTSAEA